MSLITHHRSARLERLRHCLLHDPNGPAWLWRIRIRILKFLIAQYGNDQVASRSSSGASDLTAIDAVDQALEGLFRQDAASLPLRHIAKGPLRADNPGRLATSLALILDDIERLNEETMRLQWHPGFYDQVWEWWRERWCCG